MKEAFTAHRDNCDNNFGHLISIGHLVTNRCCGECTFVCVFMKPSLFSRSSEHPYCGSQSRRSLVLALQRVVLMLALVLGALSLIPGVAHAQSRVAILAPLAFTADVKSKIDGTGLFAPADVIDVVSSTPTLAQLQVYRSVLVYTDNSPRRFDRTWRRVGRLRRWRGRRCGRRLWL
jgi:hypothetical protein